MSSQRKISAFFSKKPQPADIKQSQPSTSKTQLTATTVIELENDEPASAADKSDEQPRKKQKTAQTSYRNTELPERTLERATLAHRKLVVADRDAADEQAEPARAAPKPAKYTPLEQQVVELKKKHPGVVLLVEVGYKFKVFGNDAQIAANVCNIYAYPDHAFLVAGFPVYRLPVYVRRLVAAGHKVGVVRQVESAALKAVSSHRGGPFERALTATYTAATLDAAQRADKTGEEGSLEEFAEATGVGVQHRYLMVIASSEADAGPAAQVAADSEAAARSRRSGQRPQAAGHGRGRKGRRVVEMAIESDEDVIMLDPGSEGQREARSEGEGDEQHGDSEGEVGRQDEEMQCDGEGDGERGTASKGRSSKRASRPAGKPAAAAGEAREQAPVGVMVVEASTGDAQLGLCSVEGAWGVGAHRSARARPEGAPSPTTDTASDAGLLDLESCLLSVSPAELVVVEPVSPVVMRILKAYTACTSSCRLEVLRGVPHTGPDALRARLKDLYAGAPAALHAVGQLPLPAARALVGGADYLATFGLDGVLRPPVAPAHDPRDGEVGEAVEGGASEMGGSGGMAGTGMDTAEAGAGTGASTGAGEEQRPGGGGSEAGRAGSQHAASTSTAGYTGGGRAVHGMGGMLRALGLVPLRRAGRMRLHANALRQLEVLEAKVDGSEATTTRGSLLHLMDRTSTPFGGRLLRRWLVEPLGDAGAINARLDAVEELTAVSGGAGPLSRLPGVLRSLPDLERGVTRCLLRTAPPSEAFATLSSLQTVARSLGMGDGGGLEALGEDVVTSPLLRQLLMDAASRGVAATCAELLGVLNARAARDNAMTELWVLEAAAPGVYACKRAVAAAEDHLKGLLPGLAKDLGVRVLEYVTIQNQGEWLVEVPVEQERRVPTSWHKVCATKKVARFHPPAVRDGILQLEVAHEKLGLAAREAWLTFLSNFSANHYALCKAAIAALAQLDVLSSLSSLARAPGYVRPRVLPPDAAPPHLSIKGGRHPILDAAIITGSSGGRAGSSGGAAGPGGCVPNDLSLSGEGRRAAVITGPNMGGKSCLSRAACLLAVMAQVGSFVPADSLSMGIFDGVFTRMGASDNLIMGRSTFAEELGDASYILSHATPNSLVVLDELGRGTATLDGVAIATATLHHLLHTTRALTLFITHYPEVAQMAASMPDVAGVYHMAYLREDVLMDAPPGSAPATAASAATTSRAAAGGGSSGPAAHTSPRAHPTAPTGITTDAARAAASAAQEAGPDTATAPGPAQVRVPRLTFLYKLREGAADESFGLNVAAIAGVPQPVVARAAVVAGRMREEVVAMAARARDVKELTRVVARIRAAAV